MSETGIPQMRAVSQDTAGGPEVLKVITTDRPVPGPTEVLVRVHAAGVNPTDWKTRAAGRFLSGSEPPFVLGFDVSGVVEAVGLGVTLFAPGDKVFGMPRFPHPPGPTPSTSPPPRGTSPTFPRTWTTSGAPLSRWRH